jgi:hypothetical protein
MTRAHRTRVGVGAAALVAALVYLYDPPWAGRITSGLQPWEENPRGTFFRWTLGRACFFIPATATWIMLPVRSVFPGPGGHPVSVEIRVDDRFLATIELVDPQAWVRTELPLGPRRSRRSVRRIDLRVSRAFGERRFGVITGQPTVW